MEIVLLVVGIIIYIVVGVIVFYNTDSTVLKIVFAPASIFVSCIVAIGMLISWLSKKIRLAIDTEYSEKIRKEGKLRELEQDLYNSYSSIATAIKREDSETSREFYIQQKAERIVSQINSHNIPMEKISIVVSFNYIKKCSDSVSIIYNTAIGFDPWIFNGEISLSIPIKEITVTKEQHKYSSCITEAFSKAYDGRSEAHRLAEEINKLFNNTFDISDGYEFSLCSNDSFTYRINKIIISLYK